MCVCVFLWACCPFSMCFTVSYESSLAYTIKAHPGAFKARTPVIAARSYIYTFTFIHLADAFIQSNLQLRNTISKTL